MGERRGRTSSSPAPSPLYACYVGYSNSVHIARKPFETGLFVFRSHISSQFNASYWLKRRWHYKLQCRKPMPVSYPKKKPQDFMVPPMMLRKWMELFPNVSGVAKPTILRENVFIRKHSACIPDVWPHRNEVSREACTESQGKRK